MSKMIITAVVATPLAIRYPNVLGMVPIVGGYVAPWEAEIRTAAGLGMLFVPQIKVSNEMAQGVAVALAVSGIVGLLDKYLPKA